MIVIDASVAVKWLIAEAGADEALAVLSGGSPLVSPDLIQIEVAGAVARQARDQRLSAASARQAYSVWTKLLDQEALGIRPSIAFVDRAFELSIQAQHPVADCLYIACAEALNATVLTADRAMHDRGRRVYQRIDLLQRAA